MLLDVEYFPATGLTANFDGMRAQPPTKTHLCSRTKAGSPATSGCHEYLPWQPSGYRRTFLCMAAKSVGPDLKSGGVLSRAQAVKNRQIPEHRQETHSLIL
jgi:hypothetical protein